MGESEPETAPEVESPRPSAPPLEEEADSQTETEEVESPRPSAPPLEEPETSTTPETIPEAVIEPETTSEVTVEPEIIPEDVEASEAVPEVAVVDLKDFLVESEDAPEVDSLLNALDVSKKFETFECEETTPAEPETTAPETEEF